MDIVWDLSIDSFPLIVKPAWEHCAIGVEQQSVVHGYQSLEIRTRAMWEKFRQPILVEEFLDGNEYQVTILEKEGKPWVLPPAEIIYKKIEGLEPLISFSEKWLDNKTEDDMSELKIFQGSQELRDKIERLALSAFIKLDCKDYVRLDLREKGGEVYILEVNVNPGLDWDPNWGVAVAGQAAGLDFAGLLKVIMDSAVFRFFHTKN